MKQKKISLERAIDALCEHGFTVHMTLTTAFEIGSSTRKGTKWKASYQYPVGTPIATKSKKAA